jgi:hypothetical protein
MNMQRAQANFFYFRKRLINSDVNSFFGNNFLTKFPFPFCCCRLCNFLTRRETDLTRKKAVAAVAGTLLTSAAMAAALVQKLLAVYTHDDFIKMRLWRVPHLIT